MRWLIILFALGGCTVNNYYDQACRPITPPTAATSTPAPTAAQKPPGGTYTDYAYPDPHPPRKATNGSFDTFTPDKSYYDTATPDAPTKAP